MRYLPPVGWADIATKRDLDVLRSEMAVLRSDLRGEMAEGLGGLRGEIGELRGTVKAQTTRMLFWLVPSARVRLPAAMIGAVVTTGLFSLVRYLFGIYAAHLVSGRFNFIYGAVGLSLIFLISIEVMWLVILLGVQISYVW